MLRRWRRWRERRGEVRDLRGRASQALGQMGVTVDGALALDLIILRVGVHLLEVNAQLGPVFLVPCTWQPGGEVQKKGLFEVVH